MIETILGELSEINSVLTEIDVWWNICDGNQSSVIFFESQSRFILELWDALPDLAPFLQFKKRTGTLKVIKVLKVNL